MSLDILAYAAFFLTMALTYAVICLGLNVQWGMTGLFNVGVAAFVAVGAYTSAILTTPDAPDRLGGFGLPIVVGWLGAAILLGFCPGASGRSPSGCAPITSPSPPSRGGDDATRHAQSAAGHVAARLASVFIPRPFGAWQENAALFSFANFAVMAVVVLCLYLGLEHLSKSPWGACSAPSARMKRRRRRSASGRSASAAAVYPRRRDHGARRSLPGAFHRLHRAGQLHADPHLPGLGHADRRRLRQQQGRHRRRHPRPGVWALTAAAVSSFVPPDQQARAAPCKSSPSASGSA